MPNNINKKIEELIEKHYLETEENVINLGVREALKSAISFGIEIGRVSVLEDFDSMCKADAFVGFSKEEWKAIKKFFSFNKEVSGWDLSESDISKEV